jgi:hypothetical protein
MSGLALHLIVAASSSARQEGGMSNSKTEPNRRRFLCGWALEKQRLAGQTPAEAAGPALTGEQEATRAACRMSTPLQIMRITSL